MGYRKLIIALVAMALAALVPLNDNQAEVIIAVSIAAIGGNIGEHLGGALREAMAARSARGLSGAGGSAGSEEGPR